MVCKKMIFWGVFIVTGVLSHAAICPMGGEIAKLKESVRTFKTKASELRILLGSDFATLEDVNRLVGEMQRAFEVIDRIDDRWIKYIEASYSAARNPQEFKRQLGEDLNIMKQQQALFMRQPQLRQPQRPIIVPAAPRQIVPAPQPLQRDGRVAELIKDIREFHAQLGEFDNLLGQEPFDEDRIKAVFGALWDAYVRINETHETVFQNEAVVRLIVQELKYRNPQEYKDAIRALVKVREEIVFPATLPLQQPPTQAPALHEAVEKELRELGEVEEAAVERLSKAFEAIYRASAILAKRGIDVDAKDDKTRAKNREIFSANREDILSILQQIEDYNDIIQRAPDELVREALRSLKSRNVVGFSNVDPNKVEANTRRADLFVQALDALVVDAPAPVTVAPVVVKPAAAVLGPIVQQPVPQLPAIKPVFHLESFMSPPHVPSQVQRVPSPAQQRGLLSSYEKGRQREDLNWAIEKFNGLIRGFDNMAFEVVLNSDKFIENEGAMETNLRLAGEYLDQINQKSEDAFSPKSAQEIQKLKDDLKRQLDARQEKLDHMYRTIGRPAS